MKNSQEIAIIIKDVAKSKKIAIGKMLSDCDLSVNTLSSMQSGGFFPRLEAINKIADYLDVSVDYLLGRTDNPNINSDIINTGDINGNGNVQAVKNGNITISAVSDDISSEFMEIFKKLEFSDKLKAMQFVDDLNRGE